jgi:PPP family 3-phenylpropionic acid transporter
VRAIGYHGAQNVTGAVPVRSFYFFFYGALGLFHPLFPLYLTERGVSPDVAVRILAIFPLAGVLAPPLVGLLADVLRARGWLLRAITFLATLSLAALAVLPAGVAGVIACTIAYACLRAPIGALVDTSACRVAEKSGTSYGQLRMWGSIGFLFAALAGGSLVEATGWAPMLEVACLAYAGTVVSAFLLPAAPHEHRPRVLPAWVRLLSRRELWLFLGTIVCSQVASAAYDSCYSLHLKHLGHGEGFIGLAWAIGVAAEIAVLAGSRRLLAAFGPAWLLAGACSTAALRWLLIAGATAPSSILALQLLHGITFPLYWVPAVVIVQALAPRELATSAQGLLAAAAGLGSVIGMGLAGPVLRVSGSERLYLYSSAAALMAALGALLLPRARVAADPT